MASWKTFSRIVTFFVKLMKPKIFCIFPKTFCKSQTKYLLCHFGVTIPIIKRVHEVKLRHVTAIELAKQVCIAISYMNTTEISILYLDDRRLCEAIARGFDDFLKLCFQFFPELLWVTPYNKRLTTHAVMFRQEKTLGLFLQVSSTNELSLVPGPSEQDSADMMSAAAYYYRSFDGVTTEAGAAFQMQRELRWYRAVESWVVPDMRDRYMGSKTFWTSFVENRKDLLESGEKWMKDTSNSCMITSALIATVLFAAAFTVPGGNNDKSGVPLLLGEDSFLVFIISDVLGLFFSVTAILLFLAILTSRYKVQDFLEALPKKIIMGLSFLFLSLAFMLVAFTATLTIVLDKRLVEWVLIPIILLTSVPVALFIVLQLPLLYQMVKSTYGPSIFCPKSIWE
ncbi:hypothetical protein EUGRSUZ_C03529 [Eucalyptus grandis]|uniref:Uncharacterized protein n=2 Tax=Eucalyptus grandis TaxID=71139 RepID=A0ACC3LI48_EUCGR|nr:hypothetical protein EUGRSUZ_C03529 [Eucalyptus grandis]